MPAYDQARMMTPFEYFAGGLETLLQSVGAFLGLLLLAIALIVGGAVLVVGFENVKSKLGKTRAVQDTTAESNSTTERAKMRPYRQAKAQGVDRDAQIWGLLLVIAGLALLWLVPSYLFNSNKTKPSIHDQPRYVEPDSYSRKFSLASSTPSQAVLGVLTLVILLVSFAMLQPEKQTKKAAEKLDQASQKS